MSDDDLVMPVVPENKIVHDKDKKKETKEIEEDDQADDTQNLMENKKE